MTTEKKIVYVDMDNVLVDFPSAFPRVDPQLLKKHENDPDEIPGIFSLMDPMRDAIESYIELTKLFDTYILSTAPWKNPSAWTDKLLWVKKHLGEPAHKRLILSHNKNLNRGNYLIDDRKENGADKFSGMHIHFGKPDYPDWHAVMTYLRRVAN